MENVELYDATIQMPFRMCITGPSQSGKTYFVSQLLENRKKLFSNDISVIYFFYSIENQSIQELKLLAKNKLINIVFIQGIEDMDPQDYVDPQGKHCLLIFDDLMQQVMNSPKILEIFTIFSHHSKISVIIISQDFFYNSGSHRNIRMTINRNMDYLVLFCNPLDQQTAYIIASRIMPKETKKFMEIYKRACQIARYLFIDGSITTDNSIRMRTDIFGDCQRVFVMN